MRASESSSQARASVLTVGTELTEGLRADTNGPEISRRLASAGYIVIAREVLPDEAASIAPRIAQHLTLSDLVVVTGGLGPTHDDVTRDGAAIALGTTLYSDERLLQDLEPICVRHGSSRSGEQVLRQAQVLPGATILGPATGTAPGQLLRAGMGHLLLLPGPPHEMRPLLAEALDALGAAEAPEPRVLSCARMMESDAQIAAQDVLSTFSGIGLAVLARPSLVDIVLLPRGADAGQLDSAASAIAETIGPRCFSTTGQTLAETIVSMATRAGTSLAVAESCTGGLVAAGITSVPGASAVFPGGFVTYSNQLKTSLLGVPEEALREHGAVSEEVACMMADGTRIAADADIAVAITGVAGPGGGGPGKPVGTVWIAISGDGDTRADLYSFSGDRELVRTRACVAALDTLRLALAGTERRE